MTAGTVAERLRADRGTMGDGAQARAVAMSGFPSQSDALLVHG